MNPLDDLTMPGWMFLLYCLAFMVIGVKIGRER